MRLLRRLGGMLALLAILGAPLAAHADGIGIVLMHGKLGTPLGVSVGRPAPFGAKLTAALRNAGYRVETPEMCWSKPRAFDKAYSDCFADIDRAVADLKSHGMSQIIVGGLSLGGNVAIAYAGLHPDIAGVIGLSPADDPGLKVARNQNVVASLAQAKSLIGQGRGDEKFSFADVNTGPQGAYQMSLYTTPKIYLSFIAPDSLASLPATTAKLTMPLLWVAGDNDPSQSAGEAYAFDKAPANPLSQYVVVHASHLEVPDAATDTVLAWLTTLPK